jgi:hypothetical protein
MLSYTSCPGSDDDMDATLPVKILSPPGSPLVFP